MVNVEKVDESFPEENLESNRKAAGCVGISYNGLCVGIQWDRPQEISNR